MKNIKTWSEKKKTLQYLITDFAISIGFKADKERYNKAWHRLWVGIHREEIL